MRWRPSEQGEGLADKTCLPEPTQNQRLKNCDLLFKKSVINQFVGSKGGGVAPLAVDKSIIARRVALFQENWSRVSEDHGCWIQYRGTK